MIDEYLISQNMVVNEGYIGKNQSQAILESIKSQRPIKYVLEIGFNAGHSALFFLQNLEDLKLFISCDIGFHTYTESVAKQLEKQYPDIFCFLKGDSEFMLQAFRKTHPEIKFDLIFIDGAHDYKHAFLDILYCKSLSHDQTIVLIDDSINEVKKAVDLFVMMGCLDIISQKQTLEEDGSYRYWIEARFI